MCRETPISSKDRLCEEYVPTCAAVLFQASLTVTQTSMLFPEGYAIFLLGPFPEDI